MSLFTAYLEQVKTVKSNILDQLKRDNKNIEVVRDFDNPLWRINLKGKFKNYQIVYASQNDIKDLKKSFPKMTKNGFYVSPDGNEDKYMNLNEFKQWANLK